MEERQDKYPRITQVQLDLWLDSPVTKVYLQALQWSQDQIREVLGNGGFINSSSSDLTFSSIHSALGEIRGLERAGGVPDVDDEGIGGYRKNAVMALLNTHQMLGGTNDIED